MLFPNMDYSNFMFPPSNVRELISHTLLYDFHHMPFYY